MRFLSRVVLAVALVGALQTPYAHANEVSEKDKPFLTNLYASLEAAGAPLINTLVVGVLGVAAAAAYYGMQVQKARSAAELDATRTGYIHDEVEFLFRHLDGNTPYERLNNLATRAFNAGKSAGQTAGYALHEQEFKDASIYVGNQLVKIGDIEHCHSITTYLRALVGLAEKASKTAAETEFLQTSLGLIGEKYYTLAEIGGGKPIPGKLQALVKMVITTTQAATKTDFSGLDTKLASAIKLLTETAEKVTTAAPQVLEQTTANKAMLGTVNSQLGALMKLVTETAGKVTTTAPEMDSKLGTVLELLKELGEKVAAAAPQVLEHVADVAE